MIFGIIGGGVVGQATKAYLEMKGHEVRVWDVDDSKSTHDVYQVHRGDYTVMCLPTPSGDGRLDTSLLDARAYCFSQNRCMPPVIIRSTIPLGYTQKFEEMSGCPTIYWPEFLTERTAEEDALNPLINVVGYTGTKHEYAVGLTEIIDDGDWMPASCVELIKILSNTYGAVLVSLMNEFHSICQDNNVDWDTVRDGLLRTGRVLEVYSHVPGPDGKRGWGGKCWPKDAMEVLSMVPGNHSVIEAVIRRNTLDRGEESNRGDE